MPRWILHADMDAFYASIEQRDHPELRGRPVIVGASSPRGVVAAASYEARAFGVHSAMPAFRARELCPHAAFVGSSMATYAAVSDQVHRVFEEFTSEIEPLALDEAFLDITGSVGLFGGPLALARRLKRRVQEETQLPLSVGVAPNKLVAKLACSRSKPNGLLVVPPDAIRWLLDPLPIRRLWGVGPVLGSRLEAAGFTTLAELRQGGARLHAVVGDRADALAALAAGLDDRPVDGRRDPRSIGEESTFERDVSDRDTVTGALTAHAEAVARRLRRAGFRGRTITLKIKLARRRGTRTGRDQHAEPDYPVLSRARTLRDVTDDGALIRAIVIELWDQERLAEPVRLLGVTVSGLTRPQPVQLDLFASVATSGTPASAAALGPTLDAIRDKFGADAIRRAVDEPGKITHSNQRKRGD